ncbi:MAG TPA: hypothetical protein VK666_01145, partial [Chryseolinea sp.]|nr:hypothetical protein [Chryseolinea sp.]
TSLLTFLWKLASNGKTNEKRSITRYRYLEVKCYSVKYFAKTLARQSKIAFTCRSTKSVFSQRTIMPWGMAAEKNSQHSAGHIGKTGKGSNG